MKKMRKKKWIAGFLMTVFVLSMFSVYASAETPLSGKVYYICSAMNENYVIDACQNGIFNETNLQLYPKKNNGANQRYMIVSVGGGWYKIVNMGANLVLDVYGNSSSSENLQLHAYNGGDNQLFKFEYAGNGYYYIKNKKGCYIDVSGGVCRAEQNIITYPLNHQKNQKWKLILASSDNRMAIPEGTYTIHSKMNKNLVLDVTNGSTMNGALLELWSIKDDKTRNNQIFNVTANGSCYRLTDTNSGKSVDLYENKTVNCQPIGIWDPNNTDAQKYIFRSTNEGDGSFYIENVSGYVLDAEGGKNKAGTRIILYKKISGAANQIWFLEKAVVSSNPTVFEPVNPVSSYDEKVSNFINDKSYKKGASWGSGQRPRLSSYSGTGCCAYAADFVKYVFGKDSPRGGVKFGSAKDIRSGDVVVVTGSQHWIVVLYRSGNKLTTAEGNWTGGRVEISSLAYKVQDGKLYRNNKKFRTFSAGYHFR